MQISGWTYRKLPGWNPEAVPAAWRAALAALDFRPVGVLEKRLPPLTATGDLPAVDVPRWEQTGVEQIGVLSSPDRRAFAAVVSHFDEHLLSLRTLTAAGVVVETTMAPQARTAEMPETLTAGIFGGRWLGRLAGRLGQRLGKEGPAWIREARPEAGYYLTLVAPAENAPEMREAGATEAQAAALWQRHRERLATVAGGAEIPPHDDLALYLALLWRTEQVTDAFATGLEQLSTYSTYVLAALALLTAVALPLYLFAQGGLAAASLGPLTWLGGGLLVLMALILLAQPLLRALILRRTAERVRPLPAAEVQRRVEREDRG